MAGVKNEWWWWWSIYDDDDDQSLKLAPRQPCVRSVSDFIFLASAYEGGWPVLTVSSSHWQCAVCVLIIAGLARGAGRAEISNQISVLDRIWTLNITVGGPASLPLGHRAMMKRWCWTIGWVKVLLMLSYRCLCYHSLYIVPFKLLTFASSYDVAIH